MQLFVIVSLFVSFSSSASSACSRNETLWAQRNTEAEHLAVVIVSCAPYRCPVKTLTNVNLMSAPSYGSSTTILMGAHRYIQDKAEFHGALFFSNGWLSKLRSLYWSLV